MKTKSMVTYRIYAEDVDHMGIVYHANYLLFFERARTELLRENNFTLPELAKSGQHFAIYKANIHYIAPARLDDLITIKTNFVPKKATMLEFNQTMSNQQGKVLCEAIIDVVSLNENFKPIRIPVDIHSGM